MGRIGKTYPRFKPSEEQDEPAAEHEPGSRMALLGAALGALAALGLIAFLVTR